MDCSARQEWWWKPKEGPGTPPARLLYEPGNWGDVLKGCWAWLTVQALLEATPATRLTVVDPFAGAPTYPLSAAARARLMRVSGTPYAELQQPFAARGELASTSRSLLEAVHRRGREMELRVFDAAVERRQAWASVAGAVPVAGSAAELLSAGSPTGDEAPYLTLIDPYDLFDHWGRLQPHLGALSSQGCVLLYLYNKSPRGAGHYDQYCRLAQGLRAALAPKTLLLLGRIPADARLPRAFHEVWLVGPAVLLERLQEELGHVTKALAGMLSEDGAFEVLSATDPDPGGLE